MQAVSDICPSFQLNILFSGKVQAQHPFQVDLAENTILCLIWIHPLALHLLTGKKFACFCLWLIIKFSLLFALWLIFNLCCEILYIHQVSIPLSDNSECKCYRERACLRSRQALGENSDWKLNSHEMKCMQASMENLVIMFILTIFSSSDEQVNDPPKLQHYMSDSELELHQSQEYISRENEIRWAWGKLPQVWLTWSTTFIYL